MRLGYIESVLDANPGLDVTRVEHWVREFAEALEAPELWTDLEALLLRVGRNEQPRAGATSRSQAKPTSSKKPRRPR